VPDDDARDLREHIDAAHAAAERLVREAESRARAAAAESEGVPPRGWDVPEGNRAPAGDLSTVVALLDALRGAIPTELTVQLAEALRELLLAVRALIDWYLERLERVGRGDASPPGGDRVQDIPID
jgi:hypothetical protein